MKTIFKFILFVIAISVVSCYAGKNKDQIIELKDPNDFKEIREYYIIVLDSTMRYYTMETLVKNDTAILVIDKKSKQLKGKKLKENQLYSFDTYRHNDVITPNASLCHFVDDKLVWCFTDNKELYFTEGMGNGHFEWKKWK